MTNASLHENPMEPPFPPCAGPDGHPGDPIEPSGATLAILRGHRHAPYTRALEELTLALIRAVCVRDHLPEPNPKTIQMGSYARFQRIARIAVCLVDANTESKAKAETIRDLCDELDVAALDSKESRLIRNAIETFLANLGTAVER